MPAYALELQILLEFYLTKNGLNLTKNNRYYRNMKPAETPVKSGFPPPNKKSDRRDSNCSVSPKRKENTGFPSRHFCHSRTHSRSLSLYRNSIMRLRFAVSGGVRESVYYIIFPRSHMRCLFKHAHVLISTRR